jgi:prophage maintenance system killer protein
MAAYVFLKVNDYELDATEEEFEEIVFEVTKGEVDRPEVTRFFRRYARPVK